VGAGVSGQFPGDTRGLRQTRARRLPLPECSSSPSGKVYACPWAQVARFGCDPAVLTNCRLSPLVGFSYGPAGGDDHSGPVLPSSREDQARSPDMPPLTAEEHRVGAVQQERTDRLCAEWEPLLVAPDPHLPRQRRQPSPNVTRRNLHCRVRRGGGRPRARRACSRTSGASSGDPSDSDEPGERPRQHESDLAVPAALR
jgi:hypothetical protein